MAKKRPQASQVQVDADVVRTRSLVIVDDKGRERMSLGCGEWGTTAQVYDSRGKIRIELTMDSDDTPCVRLFDEHGCPAISMAVSAKRGVGIGVDGGEGCGSISIGVPRRCVDPRGDHPNIDVIDPVRSRTWSALQ